MANPLKSAKIAFYLPQGDDKDDDTKISVYITTKFNGQWDLQIAKKDDFAGNETWEDDGNHTYTYDLDIVAVDLTQISSDVKTQIVIKPNGNDRLKCEYTLTLTFDSGDPAKPIVLSQHKTDVDINQDNRTYNSQ
jgi:hypothetical protein